MGGLILGAVLIAFTVFSLMPCGLGWGVNVIQFLKGCVPVITVCAGCVALLVGIADIKDKAEARREDHPVSGEDL